MHIPCDMDHMLHLVDANVIGSWSSGNMEPNEWVKDRQFAGNNKSQERILSCATYMALLKVMCMIHMVPRRGVLVRGFWKRMPVALIDLINTNTKHDLMHMMNVWSARLDRALRKDYRPVLADVRWRRWWRLSVGWAPLEDKPLMMLGSTGAISVWGIAA